MKFSKICLLTLLLWLIHSSSAYSFEVPEDVITKEKEIVEISRSHIRNNTGNLNLILKLFKNNKRLYSISQDSESSISGEAFDSEISAKLLPFRFDNKKLENNLLSALSSLKTVSFNRQEGKICSNVGNAEAGKYLMESTLVYQNGNNINDIHCENREKQVTFRACQVLLFDGWYLHFFWSDPTRFKPN